MSVLLMWQRLTKAVQVASTVELEIAVLLPVTMPMPFQKCLHAKEVTSKV